MAGGGLKDRVKVPCRSCGRPIRRSVAVCPYCAHGYRPGGSSDSGEGESSPTPGGTGDAGGSGGGSPPPGPALDSIGERLVAIWAGFAAFVVAAGNGIKRALGIDAGEAPLVVGQIADQRLVERDSSDRPPWARLIRAGATFPALAVFAAIATVWMAARPLFLAMRLMTGSIPGFAFASMGRGLFFGAIAGALGVSWLNRRKAKRVVWLLEINVGSGRRAVRLALPENHGHDLINGDRIEVWGREHRDGTLRAGKIRSVRTGKTLKPRFVHPAIWCLYAVGAIAAYFVLAGESPSQMPTDADGGSQPEQQNDGGSRSGQQQNPDKKPNRS